MITVNFDYPTLQRLKKAYKQAVKAEQDQFTFEGNEYVVGYAKYLIEYLESRLHVTVSHENKK